MKPIRVSTCLCHFHVVCICKRSAPITAQLHGQRQPIGPSTLRQEPMGGPAPSGPALPDTLPGEKQHGAANCLYLPTLTRRTSSTSAAFRSTVLLDFTAELRESLNPPLHPGKVRVILRRPARRQRHERQAISLGNHAEEFDADAINRHTAASKD